MCKELLEYKPYSWKKSKARIYLAGVIPVYRSEYYEILFEDTVIREYHGLLSELKDIVVLLNAAYMSGVMSALTMKDC